MDNQIDISESSNPQSAALAQLIKDLGIDTLAPDKQNELIIKMTEVLLKRIFLETMESLNEEGRKEYEKLTAGEIEPEKVEAFFKEKIKNYDEMVQVIIDEFKHEMMTTEN